MGVMAWTWTYNLRVVLGSCAQNWPCETSEGKRGHKPKATRKELEKWPSYADPNLGQKWRAGLFSANNWPYILRYGLQICFTHIYINIKEHPQPMAQNRVLESERAGPPLKCNWCNHSYLKSMLFCSGFKEGAWYIYS